MATRKSTTSKSHGKRSLKAESNGVVAAVSSPAAGAAEAQSSNGGLKSLPTADQIRFRAYEIFVARGGDHGDDWNDWFVAERELSAAPKSS